MKKSIKAFNISATDKYVTVNYTPPKVCPACGVSTNNDEIIAIYVLPDRVELGIMALICYCSVCDSFYFVVYYIHSLNQGHQYNTIAENHNFIYPNRRLRQDFSENIERVSKRFIEIYKQASIAESENLVEICGMGYRKALEFLIKDYVIFKNPNLESIIKSLPLSKVIDAYVDSSHIKTLALASAWIGNDETHYVRKHEDFGVDELKAFISATVSFIDSEINYFKAKLLTERKKK